MKTNTTSARVPAVVAYDYDRQVWVTGAEAVELRRSQLVKELALLTGADGERYHAFARRSVELSLAEAIVIVRGKLYDLPAVVVNKGGAS